MQGAGHRRHHLTSPPHRAGTAHFGNQAADSTAEVWIGGSVGLRGQVGIPRSEIRLVVRGAGLADGAVGTGDGFKNESDRSIEAWRRAEGKRMPASVSASSAVVPIGVRNRRESKASVTAIIA